MHHLREVSYHQWYMYHSPPAISKAVAALNSNFQLLLANKQILENVAVAAEQTSNSEL